MHIESFFDPKTFTLTYIVYDPESRDAVVIDPVLDYDPASSQTSLDSLNPILSFIEEHRLRLHYILETHAHADHLSGAQSLRRRYPDAQVAVGARIVEVQQTFRMVFGLPAEFPVDGSQFDILLKDRQIVQAGSLSFEVIYTPGHTPACVTFRFEDALFTGDCMFMPDFGVGRCDFPAGSASSLYDSITERLYTFPDSTRIFVGHDYQPGGRELRFETTVAEQKEKNVQLPGNRSKDDFVTFRTQRDAKLSTPKLLFQSVQVNIAGGVLPNPEANQVAYLKIPVNLFLGDSTEDAPPASIEAQEIDRNTR